MDSIVDYSALSPDMVLNAIESLGFLSDGRSLALNSYENRVYQVGIEEEQPLVAKFYRPNRWSDAQIQEEHDFSWELKNAELPVVAPLRINEQSLFSYKGYRFAIYPRQGGREPNLDDADNLLQLGRFLGRMHTIAKTTDFTHRPAITINSFGYESVAFITEHFIPPELKTAYSSLCKDLLQQVNHTLEQYRHIRSIRSHGDCHVGNILWRDDSPHFVDFDDARSAPAVQDIWLVLSGERHEQELQLSELMEGYREFCDFDPQELWTSQTLLDIT